MITADRFARLTTPVILAVVVAQVALHTWQLILSPWFITFTESAQFNGTLAVLKGIDPWDPQNAPRTYNVYGPLSLWISAGMARITGTISIPGIRSVNFIYLAGIAALVYKAGRFNGFNRILSFSVTLCVHTGLLTYVIPSMRPDLPATLFYLGLIFLPVALPPRRRLAATLIFSAFGFLAKPYAILGLVSATLYLAKARGFKSAAANAAAGSIGIFCAITLTNLYHPSFFQATSGIHASATTLESYHLWAQTKDLARSYLPLGIALITVILFRRSSNIANSPWNIPLLVASITFFGFLGRHTGATWTYALELLAAPALLWSAAIFKSRGLTDIFIALIFAITTQWYFVRATDRMPPQSLKDARSQQALRLAVQQRRTVLLPSLLADQADADEKILYDNGQTRWLETTGPSNPLALNAKLHFSKLKAGVAAGNFDTVICGHFPSCREFDLTLYQRTGTTCFRIPAAFETICLSIFDRKETQHVR